MYVTDVSKHIEIQHNLNFEWLDVLKMKFVTYHK